MKVDELVDVINRGSWKKSSADAKAMPARTGGNPAPAIGTLIVMVIPVAMVYLEVGAAWRRMIFGILLVVAIAATVDRSKLRGAV